MAAAMLAAALLAALVAAVSGNLADAWDDVLPLLFALSALAAVAGWYLDRRGSSVHLNRGRGRAGTAGAGAREARAAGERARRRDTHARPRALAPPRGGGTEPPRDRAPRRTVALAWTRLESAHRQQREWTRELRGQGEMVLQVALKLVEAEKGLLLSREDRDGDGDFDLACHLGFEHDPEHSALAQRFACQVLKRDETIREDSAAVGRERRTPADEEIHNLIAIPIYIQDDFSGVLVCANRDGGFEELQDDVLLSLGDHAGAVLENGRLHGELRASYMATVRMLAEAIEVKDPSVRIHSDEVAGYVASVAAKLQIEPRRREELTIASLLHDVGKIGISERILLGPARSRRRSGARSRCTRGSASASWSRSPPSAS